MATMLMEMFSQVSQVTESLFISSCYALKPERLKQLGINFIVNCTLEVPTIQDPQIETVQIHVDDTPFTNLKIYFDRITDRIADTISRGGKVLVHCVAGVSRSASMVVAYLMKHKRMSLREAFQLLRQKRPIVRPNVGFWRQLIQYETKLFGTSTVRMVDSAFGQVPDVYKEESQSRNLMWPSFPNAFPPVSNSNSMPSLSVNSLNNGNSVAASQKDIKLSSMSGASSNLTARGNDSIAVIKERESTATSQLMSPSLPSSTVASSVRYRSTNTLNTNRTNQLYSSSSVQNRNSHISSTYTPLSPGLSVIGRSHTAQNALRPTATSTRYSSTFSRLGFM